MDKKKIYASEAKQLTDKINSTMYDDYLLKSFESIRKAINAGEYCCVVSFSDPVPSRVRQQLIEYGYNIRNEQIYCQREGEYYDNERVILIDWKDA